MTAFLWKVSTINGFNSTLNGSINDSDTTITLSATTGLQAPGILVIDRVDSTDTSTPSLREYVSFTGISSNQITGVTRARASSTAQSHNSGAKVEEVISATHWGDFYDWAIAEHGTDGTHKADAINAITEIATAIKSGADAKLITGTAGTSGDMPIWNADGDIVDGPTPPTGAIVGTTDTQTLTNKRITPRTGTTTSHATPTINTDNVDFYSITAQTEAITSMTTNLSGTPTNFQSLVIRIKDDGTARAITWGASFEAKGSPLPTTTVLGKVLTVGFMYDTVTSKWGCLAVQNEA